MDLTRQEYPALLTSLQPNQAVTVLNERVRLIGKINGDISDWLAERRRVEEAYVQGLKRLASRRQDNTGALGVFQAPWQSIVTSTSRLADSHANYAARIEADVEKPLREYGARSREMQGMNTIQGNLASLARDLENAQKKASRGRTDDSNLQEAQSQWESQAPYVFEQLQALDENRVNHLRDALTQLETHEMDRLERSRLAAEGALNALLNVDTTEEISTFVARTSEGISNAPNVSSPARRSTRPTTSGAGSSYGRPDGPPSSSTRATPPTETLYQSIANRQSNVSGLPEDAVSPLPEPKKSRLGGLRRLGTVMTRRGKDKDKPLERTVSSEDKKSKRQSRFPLGRGSSANMQQIPSPNMSITDLPITPVPEPTVNQPEHILAAQRPSITDVHDSQEASGVEGPVMAPQQAPPNTAFHAPREPPQEAPPVNGFQAHQESSVPNGFPTQRGPTIEPVAQPAPALLQPARPSSSAIDAITRAQQEAAEESEQQQQAFRLDIRQEPIHEEAGDAQTAISNVTNALRASQMPPPQRRTGTVRGRRDVRNTMFFPSPPSIGENSTNTEPMPAAGPMFMGSNMLTQPSILTQPALEHRASDAQSIRSAHSVGTTVSQGGIRHPDMQAPGLNASIVETSSASFSNGTVTKATVVGEIALVHNGIDNTGSPHIRIDNFPVLEKVATNPTFVSEVPSRSGEYTLDLSQLSPKAVAFKYQVHLDDTNLATFAPLTITPTWKIEPNQASVILAYTFNPAFRSARRSITLSNAVLVLIVEGTRATSCQSKPPGVFSREKNMIYWKLGSLVLDEASATTHKFLARFATEGEARPGNVEARWEIVGEAAAAVGSGLGLSVIERAEGGAADPFADEGMGSGVLGQRRDVPVVRRLVSGRYVAG